MAEQTLLLKILSSGAERKLKQLEDKMNAFEKAAKKAQGTLPKTNKQIKETGKAANESAKGIGKLQKKLLGLGKTIAVGAGVMTWFKGFAEADRASGAVRTLGVNVDELKKKLFDVSVASGNLRSQTELLSASYDVASAGFTSAADISKILAASVDGAVGGMTTMAKVSDAATSVMNTYGKSADEARGLIDGFIQTQNDGKIILDQYASQIGRLAPMGAAAGVGIQELNAAISAITATGLPVEQTFTGLKMVLQGIVRPTSEAAAIAKKLGIDFDATALKGKGFAGVLQDMIQKTGGNKEAMGRMFGSVEALNAFLPLVNDNLAKFNKNLDNQKNASGAASEAAKIMSGTVGQALGRVADGMGNIIRNLDYVGVAFKYVLSIVNEFIQGFLQMPKWFQIATTSAVALGIALLAFAPMAALVGASIAKMSLIAMPALGSLAIATVVAVGPWIALAAGITAAGIAVAKWFGKKNQFKGAKLDDLIASEDGGKLNKALEEADKRIQKLRDKMADVSNYKGQGGKGKSKNDKNQLAELLAAKAEIEKAMAALENTAADKIGGKGGVKEQSEAWLKAQQALKELNKGSASEGEKLFEQLTKENEMLEAKIKGTEAVKKLERDILATKLKAAGFSEAEIKAILDQNEALKKKLTYAEKLKDLWKSIGDDIKSGVVDGIKAAITGAKTFGEVMSNVLGRIGDKLLNLAIDGMFSSLGKGGGFLGKLFGGAEGGLARGGISSKAFAQGGVATGPTLGLVGEAGEDEYMIPSSKMAGAMQRYSAGARGQAVIPGGGTVAGGTGMPATSTTVNYTGPVLSFNSESYVPKSAIPEIINSAARRGAQEGESKVFRQLKNSRSQRSRLGMA